MGVGLSVGLCVLVSSVYALPFDLDRRVTVQPIQVRTDEGAGGATVGFFEPETDQIWRQAGLDIDFLGVTTFDETDFLILDDTTEVINLFTEHAQSLDPFILNMWFVDIIFPLTTTFGIAFVGGNGIAIAAAVFAFNGGIGRLDTVAHEIGHNLGLPHPWDAPPLNLMTTGARRTIPSSSDDMFPNGAQTDQLTDAQIRNARGSPFAERIAATPIAEPATLELLVVGLGFVLWLPGYTALGGASILRMPRSLSGRFGSKARLSGAVSSPTSAHRARVDRPAGARGRGPQASRPDMVSENERWAARACPGTDTA